MVEGFDTSKEREGFGNLFKFILSTVAKTKNATIGFEKFWPIIRFGILTKQSMNIIE